MFLIERRGRGGREGGWKGGRGRGVPSRVSRVSSWKSPRRCLRPEIGKKIQYKNMNRKENRVIYKYKKRDGNTGHFLNRRLTELLINIMTRRMQCRTYSQVIGFENRGTMVKE